MNRYDLHVARDQFDEFVKAELAPNGRWVMYQDVAARIAELKAALQSIVEYCDEPYLHYTDIMSKARAALGEQE